MRILRWSLCGVVLALIVGLVVAIRPPVDPPARPSTTRGGAEVAHTGSLVPRVAHHSEPPRNAPTPRSAAVPRVDVAPQRPLSSTEARDQVREVLQRSGRSMAPWTARVGRLLADWHTVTPQLAGRVTVGPVDCYREGCSIELTSVDRAAFEEVNESLPTTRAFMDFPGWRHRTGVVTRADGSVTATWFFMRPDGPVAERE